MNRILMVVLVLTVKPRQSLIDTSVHYPWPNSGTGREPAR
ncbi:MAG: hypothetical protein NVS2B16_35270 [Chloroflexota bacterium]